jgi:hypothetical protein
LEKHTCGARTAEWYLCTRRFTWSAKTIRTKLQRERAPELQIHRGKDMVIEIVFDLRA